MTKFRALAATAALLCLSPFGVPGIRRQRRGQRLYLSRKPVDPAFVRCLHGGHRHQGQCGFGEFRPGAAHEGRGRQQPRRRAADGRHRPHGRSGEGRGDAADQVGSARQDRAGAISRPRRSVGRHLDARARDLCLEGCVKQDAITYEELADPKWKGKICIRSGQHIYNNGLFAPMSPSTARPRPRSGCAA